MEIILPSPCTTRRHGPPVFRDLLASPTATLEAAAVVAAIIDFPHPLGFRFPEAPDEHHDPEPVPEVNNALERGYPQATRHEKIADLFYNPGGCPIYYAIINQYILRSLINRATRIRNMYICM